VAELYTPGKQRIFYRASALKQGLNVHVEIHNQDLNRSETVILVESVVKGLYYFDFVFNIGIYLAYFYENGQAKGIQVYNIINKNDWSGNSIIVRRETQGNILW
jgi:hypothetical protein